jgi:hypothetical protein
MKHHLALAHNDGTPEILQDALCIIRPLSGKLIDEEQYLPMKATHL